MDDQGPREQRWEPVMHRAVGAGTGVTVGTGGGTMAGPGANATMDLEMGATVGTGNGCGERRPSSAACPICPGKQTQEAKGGEWVATAQLRRSNTWPGSRPLPGRYQPGGRREPFRHAPLGVFLLLL
jgi:hypothetical protein